MSSIRLYCNSALGSAANSYLGGSVKVAPKPPAVRLSRSPRLGARRQKHCATIDLTIQAPTLVNLRRIRIRYVHNVTEECRGQLET
jgi:hypothetical protein